jgi:hypothetical protein
MNSYVCKFNYSLTLGVIISLVNKDVLLLSVVRRKEEDDEGKKKRPLGSGGSREISEHRP